MSTTAICVVLLLVVGRSVGPDKETSQQLAHVIEASCLALVYLDQALLLLVLPDPGAAVLGAREEGAVLRIQVNRGD